MGRGASSQQRRYWQDVISQQQPSGWVTPLGGGLHLVTDFEINSLGPTHDVNGHRSHDCETLPIWTPWGWAVDRKRLTWLIVNWCFTCHFRSQYRRTRREVFPILIRVLNIG